MISVRRALERKHEHTPKCDTWLTFYRENDAEPARDLKVTSETLSETRLAPRGHVLRRRHADVEIVTYVRQGALSYRHSNGRSGFVHTGEFQLISAGLELQHSEENASLTDWAQFFQVWLRAPIGRVAPGQQQKRFSVAERRGGLRVVASPDARFGSLLVHEDAIVFSAMLEPGQHVVHELGPARVAWLQVIEGEVKLGDLVLGAGDGAGLAAERAISFTARSEAEVLLVDVAARNPLKTNGALHGPPPT